MRTFLTTSRMAPALVERIEASVSGRRGTRSRGVTRLRLATWFRLATFASLVVALASFMRLRRLEHEQLEVAPRAVELRVGPRAGKGRRT